MEKTFNHQSGPNQPMRIKNLLTGVCCLLFLSGCTSGPGASVPSASTSAVPLTSSGGSTADPDAIRLKGLVLTNGTIFVLEAPGSYGLAQDLLTIHMPSDAPLPKAGTLAQFVIGSTIRESYPPQADGRSIQNLQADSPVVTAPIGKGPAIKSHLQNDSLLLDVRTPSEFAGGHLEDAVNLPVDQIASGIAAKATDKSLTLLVYCRSGSRSAAAAKQLKEMGYRIVIDLGGILDYDGELITEPK